MFMDSSCLAFKLPPDPPAPFFQTNSWMFMCVAEANTMAACLMTHGAWRGFSGSLCQKVNESIGNFLRVFSVRRHSCKSFCLVSEISAVPVSRHPPRRSESRIYLLSFFVCVSLPLAWSSAQGYWESCSDISECDYSYSCVVHQMWGWWVMACLLCVYCSFCVHLLVLFLSGCMYLTEALNLKTLGQKHPNSESYV